MTQAKDVPKGDNLAACSDAPARRDDAFTMTLYTVYSYCTRLSCRACHDPHEGHSSNDRHGRGLER